MINPFTNKLYNQYFFNPLIDKDDPTSSKPLTISNLAKLKANRHHSEKKANKMPNEHFCLKWNNFQRNIVAALGNLKLDEDFVDVTISCEGKMIKAHKVILSACSDYFRDLFRVRDHPYIMLAHF